MGKVNDKEEIKKKANIRNKVISILIFIIITLLMFFMFRTVIQLIKQPSDVFVVEEGTLSLEETSEAYIIRNEIVLKGENYKNGMEKTKAEGKKVAKGDTIFRYYASGEEELKKKIEEINKEILEAQAKEPISDSSEIGIVKKQIKELLEKMADSNNVEDLEMYKKEIAECNEKMTKIIGENTKKGSYLQELIDKKAKYEKELYNNAEIIKAKKSGVVSYRVDGFEDVLKVDKDASFSYLTEEFLENLDLRTGELVASSNEKGKVITSFDVYLATVLSSDAAKNVKENASVKIDIGEEKPVRARVAKIKEEGDKRLIVFRIVDLSETILNYRKISVDVIWWSYSGLKVPNSAIIKEGDYNYVIRNRAGFDSKILVKVLQSNDTYSLVENYSPAELSEMGYNASEIRNMFTIKLYDKIKTEGK